VSQRAFDPQAPLPNLSSCESEILVLVERGRSNKEIARQLAISVARVKNHMHSILQKLQVNARPDRRPTARVARRLSQSAATPIPWARHERRQDSSAEPFSRAHWNRRRSYDLVQWAYPPVLTA